MTSYPYRTVSLAFALMATSIVLPQPANAQSLDALDQLIAASAKPADAIALARLQADSGALLDALATLERILLSDPANKPASLLHASILCRIDDRDGAAAEFARLKSKDFKKPEWAAARAPCDVPAALRQGVGK